MIIVKKRENIWTYFLIIVLEMKLLPFVPIFTQKTLRKLHSFHFLKSAVVSGMTCVNVSVREMAWLFVFLELNANAVAYKTCLVI